MRAAHLSVLLKKRRNSDPKYNDYQFLGKFKDFRNRRIRPDLLLFYEIQETALELYLYRIGNYSKLYKK